MDDRLGLPPVGLLQGKLAVVTGGAGGLGAAICHGMAAQGASVIVVDIKNAGQAATAAGLTDKGFRADFFETDVSDRAAVDEAAAQIRAQHGNIDIVVNAAGIARRALFGDDDSPEVWDQVIAVNLQGTFNVSHAFVPSLKETCGTIINLCSIVAFSAGISSAAYVASKGGVRSLTQAMARDLAPFGIRVNAVAPGVMDTPMTLRQRTTPQGLDWYLSRTPLGRTGRADELIGPILFLSSVMASYVTGVILPVDGGYLST